MGLVEQLRASGIAMGSWYAPQAHTVTDEDGSESEIVRQTFVGWTPNEALATAAQEMGATIRWYISRDDRFSGYEVAAHEVIGG